MPSEDSVRVSAPGRVILFGEHAVDFGFPAAAIAVEPRVRCTVQPAPRFTVNGEDLDPAKHALVRAAVLHGWPDMDRPLAFSIESGIPPGFGGNASVIVACLGAMSMLHDHMIYEHVAKNAFLASCEADEGRDPLDTSTATHGGIVTVGTRGAEDFLWSVADGDRRWHVGDIPSPAVDIVLGFTGAQGVGDVRGKVARYCERNSFARDIVRDIGDVALEGVTALEAGDVRRAGDAMNRNQRLLANLGASNPALDRLLAAVSRHAHGAKATGYSGDSIVTLARDSAKVVSAIEAARGRAIIASISPDGVRPDD